MDASKYECSICIETAKEPVVTKCGHLFCWPCIYEVIKCYLLVVVGKEGLSCL